MFPNYISNGTTACGEKGEGGILPQVHVTNILEEAGAFWQLDEHKGDVLPACATSVS